MARTGRADAQMVRPDCSEDLFALEHDAQLLAFAPLARRVRPTALNEVVGQDHLLKEGALLRRLIESDQLTSIILYGPPGTGKTSLASVIAHLTCSHFVSVNAVSTGVSDLRRLIDAARARLLSERRRTIMFIDEIHRLNKTQQDVLLPHIEDGHIVVIGATVENPFFYIVSPLISRSRVFELKPLSDEDCRAIFKRAVADERGFQNLNLSIEEEALQFMIDQSEGDARRFLNTIEVAVLCTAPDREGKVSITRETARASISHRIVRYDRGGNDHYNTASAFIKSMRGSDPDACLYWLARMVAAGEDPRFIARRIIICAAEDVGNADPQALVLACAAHTAAEIVGMPEAQIPLAQAAVYVAAAPKSNACCTGIAEALDDVRNSRRKEVPEHLQDSSYAGAERLGHGQGYQYPHSFQGGHVDQVYLPGAREYYRPMDRGFESVIRERLEQLRRMRAAPSPDVQS